ncbi:MAG: D-alanyl-D-alanine carboxypeptidase [Cyanobacteria bacterium P01_D01_bin.73]
MANFLNSRSPKVPRWRRTVTRLGAALAVTLQGWLPLSPAIAASSSQLDASSGEISPELAESSAVGSSTTDPMLLAQTGRVCANDLGMWIDRVVSAPTFQKGRWGIKVQALQDGTVFYERNSNGFFIPASNMKLFVTAAALQRYGPEARPYQSRVADWVKYINERSNNKSADALFRTMGYSSGVKQALQNLQVNPNGFRMRDGSGLSRGNSVQPGTVIQLLAAMDRAQGSDAFRRSLPIAGYSGTLRRRFKGTPVAGRVFAKTGTLRGVRALSGYLEHPLYGTLLFSILVNQPGQSGNRMLGAIDSIVGTVMSMRPCEDGVPVGVPEARRSPIRVGPTGLPRTDTWPSLLQNRGATQSRR